MIEPYKEKSANFLYNLLFCDELSLFKTNTQDPPTYPFDILFDDAAPEEAIRRITEDTAADPRVRVLAYNKFLSAGIKPVKKELLAVIVEVGLDQGLDVLASFADGTARYINQSEKILIWETTDDATALDLTRTLFSRSAQIVNQIGPWDQARRAAPEKGMTRISFLVSDGLYFGEAPTNLLFNDQLAGPALQAATQLMQYLTSKSLES
ncbi:MAG: hypothetical protein EOO09_22295 [Chitinophagaceae bacterium]|nr:MAG: hypothetical protein EOO09_22295 [Chitinophagaceae bacterium]